MALNSRISEISLGILFLATLFWISHADKYTAQENAALEEFRPLVQNIIYRDYMKEDHFLIRWLRARDLNVQEARTMLAKAVRWRRENKIDTILNETILTFPVTPFYHDSFSYSGHPVSTINIRALEMKRWILAGKRKQIVRFIDQVMEIGEVGVRYLGERLPSIRQLIVIYDYSGYNQRQHGCIACIPVFQEWARHYENYYPQLIKSSFVVNAPRIIKPMITAIKSLLSPHSQKGLQIFGQNKKEWRAELFKIVPRNQLRSGLGGTKSDFVPCAVQDFVCICKIFFKTAGQGTNTTISLAAGLRRIDADIC